MGMGTGNAGRTGEKQIEENERSGDTREGNTPALTPRRPEQEGTGAAYGGIGAVPHRGALHGGQAAAAPFGKGRFPGFVHHGGPVLAWPRISTAYWGARWKGVAHQARAERLDQFLTELMQSDFMNILGQYGVGPGEFAGRSVLADAASLPDVLTDGDVQRLIQEQITRGLWPEPTSGDNALLIYLDEDINAGNPNSPHSPPGNPMGGPNENPNEDCAFGYHSVFRTQAGNPFPYAVLPAVTDVWVRRLCSEDAACSLHLAQTQEQRQTQTTSHALAEITTNPQLNAWFDPAPDGGEIGDIGNGESAMLVMGANHWTAQRIYSKFHDMQTEGTLFCASEAPLPLAPLFRVLKNACCEIQTGD